MTIGTAHPHTVYLTNESFISASLSCILSVSSRPFFTYWITFVHLLITILAVCIYGIAPVGFSQHETVDSVSNSSSVVMSIFTIFSSHLDSFHNICDLDVF